MAMVAYNPHERFYEKPVRVTLLRNAAWRGLLVPTCSCAQREFEMKKDWLHCTKCGAPAKTLDNVARLAPSLDEALTIALASEKTE